MIATPAESVVKEERSLQHLGRISSSLYSDQPKAPFMGKRKRPEVDELMEADARLAEELQEQEYGEDEEAASTSGRARNALVDDSEVSLLSDLSRERSQDPVDFPRLNVSTTRNFTRRRPKAFPSQIAPTDVESGWSQDESAEENGTSKGSMPNNTRMKTHNRTSLPSRAARASTKKAITDSSFRGIIDSEESDLSEISDDVSLFGSDIVTDASEDSEDTDEKAGAVIVKSHLGSWP